MSVIYILCRYGSLQQFLDENFKIKDNALGGKEFLLLVDSHVESSIKLFLRQLITVDLKFYNELRMWFESKDSRPNW